MPERGMSESAHIVVVDDNRGIRDELRDYLSSKGYRVSTAEGGAEMRRILERDAADLVILDLTMPGEGGLALASDLRENSGVGIIILTGTGDAFDEVVTLELAANDYLSKPCEPRQLLARVRSVLRRVRPASHGGRAEEGEVLEFAGWSLDLSMRRLTSPDAVEVALTTAEFNLLSALATNGNQVLSRDRLLDITQGRDWSPFDRSVDNLISHLRQKVEADPKRPQLIKTVRGVGYVLAQKVNR